MGSFAKAEALAASEWVRLLQVESAVDAVIASVSVDVFLAVALGILLVTNVGRCSSKVTVALITIRKRIGSSLAKITRASDNSILAAGN